MFAMTEVYPVTTNPGSRDQSGGKVFGNGEKNSKEIKTIYELLGISTPEGLPAIGIPEKKGPPPAIILPVAEPAVEEISGPEIEEKVEEKIVAVEIPEAIVFEQKESRTKSFFKREYVLYPLIFLVTLGFFYLILNFSAISSQLAGFFDKPDEPVVPKAVTEENLAQYQKWTRKYYVYLNDPKILDPTQDPDGDALMNMWEFKLGTNPLFPDTDKDGYDDGREVLNGYNPLYEGRLTTWQEEVISKSVDLSALASRKQLQQVSGSVAVPPTPPTTQSSNGSSRAMSFGSLPVASDFLVDPSLPGNLQIPKLGVDVQITWSKEFSNMEEDLKYGVAHHPATPMPGSKGTSSIHGHSSGNPWDGNFKTIFTKLNFLEAGDEIFVTVYGTSGGVRKYRYMVRSAQVFAKSDPKQFDAGDGFFLNLSTSWPVGTARQRYVVTTELVGLNP